MIRLSQNPLRTVPNASDNEQTLRELKSAVENFVRSEDAATKFDAYSKSQSRALQILKQAECLDPRKLRTPITL